MVCEGLDFMGVELDEEKLIAYETMKIVKGLMRKKY